MIKERSLVKTKRFKANMSAWLIHSTAFSGYVSALEIRPITETPTVTTDKWAPVQEIDFNQIQQASSSDMSGTLQKSEEHAKAVVVTRPTTSVVRDDAPSSYMVLAALIGVALFSLALCVLTLPHHWFYGNTTRWRRD